ncbi:GntP family permease [Kribbella speibonae]|uniref:Gluconate permease n=1 Tax=Kribbella speibonae TaxID=1572660 RepID=A0A4R0J2G7_9ACTN|nr:SLC13 family permease [Kribbella speibonae]TCC27783.1 gluconate permease [Kribbella speibonae]TCC35355.1 gluconate permease [Kribbella speibonae]
MTSDVGILVNTAVAILGIVVLIVRFRVNPVISLVVGSLYLGLATKLGLDKTVETITKGFGDIMAEVGLLIAFGVLMGSILQELGAIERLVKHLLKLFGPKRLPYSLALTIATLLQSIYLDVLLVISAPLARSAAKRIGPLGTARMATALAIGLECGIVLMVPGVGALALSALLHVPLGKMLLWGLVLIIPTVLIAITIMTFLFRRGFWNEALDEQQVVAGAQVEEEVKEPVAVGAGTTEVRRTGSAGGAGDTADEATEKKPPLFVLFVPLLAALLLIGFGAIAEAADWENKVVALISDPVVALLVGLVGTCIVGRFAMGQPRVEKAIARGFKESGQILILTAVGGSLAAVVAAGGLGDILRGYFSANHVAPLLVVWVMAAALHVAVGSVTISAITAAGILAPIAPALGLDPVLIALAAGSGSLFAVHVTSNTFWLLQALMGQTTRGTLKSCTIGVSVASVVAIVLLMPISLLF